MTIEHKCPFDACCFPECYHPKIGTYPECPPETRVGITEHCTVNHVLGKHQIFIKSGIYIAEHVVEQEDMSVTKRIIFALCYSERYNPGTSPYTVHLVKRGLNHGGSFNEIETMEISQFVERFKDWIIYDCEIIAKKGKEAYP